MGLFIVLEGIDKGGKKTQGELLKKILEEKGYEVTVVDYPDYTRPIGQIIFKYLHKEFPFPKDSVWQFWALDQIQDRETIQKCQDDLKKIFLAVRFCHSNFAYQGVNGISLESMLEYYEKFKVPVPDLVILVDISPEESMRRKHTIKNDRYEENLEFLGKVRKKYLQFSKENVFAKEWAVVDGEKPLEDVARDIQRIVFSKLK